jgi:hypothetical protein
LQKAIEIESHRAQPNDLVHVPYGRRALALTVLATLAVGFAAKAAAVHCLSGRAPVELLGGAVRFTLTENAGAFLGLGRSLPETARRAIFVGGVGMVLLGFWRGCSRREVSAGRDRWPRD